MSVIFQSDERLRISECARFTYILNGYPNNVVLRQVVSKVFTSSGLMLDLVLFYGGRAIDTE